MADENQKVAASAGLLRVLYGTIVVYTLDLRSLFYEKGVSMATRGARGDFFIWLCSVRGWGYIGEEIFEKENLLKKLGKKVIFRR